MWVRVGLLSIVVMGLVATEARGAVEVNYLGGPGGRGIVLDGDAARNTLRVSVQGPDIVIRDESQGASLDVVESELCRQTATNEARCVKARFGKQAYVRAALGDDDTFDTGKAGCDRSKAFVIEAFTTSRKARAQIIGTANGDDIDAGGKVRGCGGRDRISMSKGRAGGGSGNDFMEGMRGVTLAGGSGKDEIEVTAGGTALGGSGNDVLSDDPGASMFTNSTGSSTLKGGAGNDVLYSGKGRDRLSGGAGRDELNAGTRQKVLSLISFIEQPTEADVLKCGKGRDRAKAGRNSKLSGCERVIRLPRQVTYG